MKRPNAAITTLLTLLLAALSACLPPGATEPALQVEALTPGQNVSFRGCSAVDDQVVWLSGSGGTVLLSNDGGETWRPLPVVDDGDLDFRDIEAFDSSRAYAMSAGNGAASRIYRTADAGSSWELLFQAEDARVFLDGMAFWSPLSGIAFGDPVDGRLFVLRTDDGERFTALPDVPLLAEGEHAYAASGTSVAVGLEGQVWVGTGGAAARVYYSSDRGDRWRLSETPIISGEPSAGIFSLAFFEDGYGVAVGGDYQRPDQAASIAISRDGGESWTAAPVQLPYRSAVAVLESKNILLAAGVNGLDYSRDRGNSWKRLSDTGYHTLCAAPSGNRAWAAGADGRAARITIRR